MAMSTTDTVTFLFTDIEGSTQLLRQAGDRYSQLLERHRSIIRSAVAEHGGTEQGTEGDSFFITFDSPSAAIATALAAQHDLVAEPWPEGLELRVRMGIHLGEATDGGEGPVGLAVHHGARIAATGHGGQIVLSDVARSATGTLPPGASVMALGSFQVRDVGTVLLHQLAAPGLPVEFPPLRAGSEVSGSLPSELSTFIGRSDELKSLAGALHEHRLVTLIGVGGTGKTRLAVETASTMASVFPDGCWMVALAPVTVEDALPFAFAAGLQMTAPATGDVLDHVIARLRDKRCLVVVDNCEHVLGAAADLVERIVGGCPTVTILATSREPLMVRGERLVPVPSLLPDEAERLFLQRAHDEAPDLVIDDDQRRAITELCRRLDGLPLALELAASRVRALTPIELVAHLEERFRMLVGGRRSRIERHQTMRGTLDWSYDLCSEVEQSVFDRLSVFPAAFDLAAARAVAGGDGVDELDVIDVVPQLVDRSLLQRSTALDGTTRFRMLETMRAYGHEHLQHRGLSDSTRERHARYTARTVAALTLRQLGPEEEQVTQRLSEYLTDALVALDWCIDHHEWEAGIRLIWVGRRNAERETWEMAIRLLDAATSGGAPMDLLLELSLFDTRNSDEPGFYDEFQARGWRRIRSGMPIATDRYVSSWFMDLDVTAANVDEYLVSLDRWKTTPPVTRFWAEYWGIRGMTFFPEVADRVDELLPPFAAFARTLNSTWASQAVAELNGLVACARHDWTAAANWYRQAKTDGVFRWHRDLTSAWHGLIARAMGSEPFELTGAELRDPWQFQRRQQGGWEEIGATATALALHRIGQTDLANRWAVLQATYLTEWEGPSMYLGGLLDRVGLPTTQLDLVDDLDTLIDEVLIVADRLDGLVN